MTNMYGIDVRFVKVKWCVQAHYFHVRHKTKKNRSLQNFRKGRYLLKSIFIDYRNHHASNILGFPLLVYRRREIRISQSVVKSTIRLEK